MVDPGVDFDFSKVRFSLFSFNRTNRSERSLSVSIRDFDFVVNKVGYAPISNLLLSNSVNFRTYRLKMPGSMLIGSNIVVADGDDLVAQFFTFLNNRLSDEDVPLITIGLSGLGH